MAERKTARRSTPRNRAESEKERQKQQSSDEAREVRDEAKNQQAEGKNAELPEEGDSKQKKDEADKTRIEQKLVSLLDDPVHPDQASPARGVAYFAVIVGVAVVLNLAVLIAISGGQ